MYFWFFACTIGMIAMVPLHFSSVAHLKLQERYGKKKGTRIAETYGLVSGWGFFSSWIGIWVSPQPRFAVPMYQGLSISVPVISILVPLSHIMVSVPCFCKQANSEKLLECTVKTEGAVHSIFKVH